MAAFVLVFRISGELVHGVQVSEFLNSSETDLETDSACPRYYQSERGSEGPSWLATDRIASDGIYTYRFETMVIVIQGLDPFGGFRSSLYTEGLVIYLLLILLFLLLNMYFLFSIPIFFLIKHLLLGYRYGAS